MLTADQLNSFDVQVRSSNEAFPFLADKTSCDDVDIVWVIALALLEAATSADDVTVTTQVCRGWRDYINTIKDDVYGAILPRRFPRLRNLNLILEPSKQVMRLSNEDVYHRHLKAQFELCPDQDSVWESLRDRPLMDPDIACTMELWLESEPVLFAALSTTATRPHEAECCPLTGLLKDMHAKEEQFLKEIVDADAHRQLEPDALAEMYDAMNKHCGWDKLSVMMHVSNGDEVVRVCRAAFLLAIHDRYLFGNSLEIPKLILSQDGLIGMPMQGDQELVVGDMVSENAVGERVRVHGLKSAHEHNGKDGTVADHRVESGRFRVVLDTGESLAVKPANLRLVEARANLSAEDKHHIMNCKLCVFTNPVFVAEVLANLPTMSHSF